MDTNTTSLPVRHYTQCSRCIGRGYLPEPRKPSRKNPAALGFYARTCPRCGGSGHYLTLGQRKED
jgi:DnaJ-class molecular chaperone